jgi:hypothetical protein
MNKLLIGIFILLLLLSVGSGIGSGVWVRDKAQNWALSSRILGGTMPQEWCAVHGALGVWPQRGCCALCTAQHRAVPLGTQR